MKILVLSDSHGEVEAMERAVSRVSPDMIFHLGDGWYDAESLAEEYPDIPLWQVPGNCDFRARNEPDQLLTIEGMRIYLCHGHRIGVKQGLREAKELAEQEDLDAFLFGHTHEPLVDKWGKTLFMNPGSIGMNYPPSFGVLTIEDDKLDGRIYTLSSGFGPRSGGW